MLRPFVQVDVFSKQAMQGNPLAVVVDASGLDEATMQAFARWTNLSETSFVLPPGSAQADYRVRIFTPHAELPFAGHPSVGTAWALLDMGLVRAREGRLVQECGAGLLQIHVREDNEDDGRIVSVQAPRALRSALAPEAIEALPQALGSIAIQGEQRPVMSDVGARWVLVEMRSRAGLRSLIPDHERITTLSRALRAEGIVVFCFDPSQLHAVELRAFAPATGVPEDPVTGSAHAAVGDWLHAQGRLIGLQGRYRAMQGSALGRNGLVEVQIGANDRVHVGGHCTALVRGAVDL